MAIPRTLIIGIVATLAALAVLYTFTDLPRGGESGGVRVAASGVASKCSTCHQRVTPDIVEQYSTSTMARAGVICEDCHVVAHENAAGYVHEGFFITSAPSPRQCARCHQREDREYAQSRHSGPAWMALTGFDDFSPDQRRQLESIPELNREPNGIPTATRNSLFDIEGPQVTPAACAQCHAIGRPNADGSIGNCNKCHLRHEFSLAQARKPAVCGQCHLGPDHPQMEIFEESAHGVMFATEGEHWNWHQRPGRLTTLDMPAPTCATCHMSGFGAQGTTHDVGDRLSKFLFAAISQDRPGAERGRRAMQAVCANCHAQKFITAVYQRADDVTALVNDKVKEAADILQGLVRDGIIPSKPFATSISFHAFDLWHYYGRTAKFAAYMQGPDYVQWHGIYPLLRELTQVKEEAAALRAQRAAGAR